MVLRVLPKWDRGRQIANVVSVLRGCKGGIRGHGRGRSVGRGCIYAKVSVSFDIRLFRRFHVYAGSGVLF